MGRLWLLGHFVCMETSIAIMIFDGGEYVLGVSAFLRWSSYVWMFKLVESSGHFQFLCVEKTIRFMKMNSVLLPN